ncbi:3'(2'),5'-bisphosphate nucleotidase CysQ [Deferribacterales bacterium RsTz2092]|nr:3'(2'),5'-bisphosphate nucleotidase CysQ [Deferribacterales bacterium]
MADMDILFKLADIAREAGDITMQYFSHNAAVERKKDGTPVTEADKAAERCIFERLAQLDPITPCIGEEDDNSRFDMTNLPKYWCIDPLDGTKEFIKDSPEFSVNIALVEAGKPTLGVIYAPALDLLYIGGEKIGSYKVASDNSFERLPLAYYNSTDITIVTSHLYSGGGSPDKLRTALMEQTDARIGFKRMGSSIKFCMVAEGSADAYIRAGRTMFWDTAAGHIIAKGAGAKVLAWNSRQELAYNTNGLENPHFIVYNTRRLGKFKF